jgi:enoyl-CoA hydratase
MNACQQEGDEMDSSEKVIVSIEDGVMTVMINRPEVRNAIDREVSYGVCAAMDELDHRDDLRVGILTGAGGTFCAGMDLVEFASGAQIRVKGRGLMGMAFTPPEKPVIAAVEGYAVGGGFEATLACDLLVAARDARFGLPEVKRGLTAAGGGLIRLPRRIPQNIAMEIALTGDWVGAERLHELGLVNRLVEPGAALSEAMSLARLIAMNAPMSVAASKKVILHQRDWATEDMFDQQEAITRPVLDSADAHEGAVAFKEKRTPRWLGQ